MLSLKLTILFTLSTLALQNLFLSTIVQAKESSSCPTTEELMSQYNLAQKKQGFKTFKLDDHIPLERRYKKIVTGKLYSPTPTESVGALLYLTYTVTVPLNSSAQIAKSKLDTVTDGGDFFIVKVTPADPDIKLLFRSRSTVVNSKCIIDITEGQYLRNR